MLPCFERVHSHRRHTLNSGQVTTTRKIFSTLYSIFRNPANGLNGMQWSGCGLVFFGLFVEVSGRRPLSSVVTRFKRAQPRTFTRDARR